MDSIISTRLAMLTKMAPGKAASPPPPRLKSLDQFRGYTVAAMFAVNFLGGYLATPAILRHHNTWCSFADTVMPQFFFAAGMALRLISLRETEKHGRAAALRRGVRRGLALMLLGVIWYGPRGFDTWEHLSAASGFDITRNVFLTSAFQALTHIGATSLWVLPVIAGSTRARVLWLLGSAVLHAGLSHVIWYKSLHAWGVIDGGPLGFLTWTLPFLAGSLALDMVRETGGGASKNAAVSPLAPPMGGGAPKADLPCRESVSAIPRLLFSAAAFMGTGYLLACFTAGGVLAAPPFVPPWHPIDMWTMSQRAGSVSYLTFSAGFSLAVFAFFHWWSDLRGHSFSLFSDLGRNALAAYLVHSIIMNFTDHLGPRASPLWWAVTLSAMGFLLCWQFTRWLNARSLFLRL
ncbi:MAG: heparan-alpha-glucosaminide N-acetyltransferase domain-containing protein [Verrucomicrobiota bacterium]